MIDAFSKYCRTFRIDPETGEKNYAIVQAEDELAAIGMVIGSYWTGARAFTATSGPGLSLMNEFLGLAYFAEIPTVLVEVQRAGPSTGMPTRTQQSDVLLAAMPRMEIRNISASTLRLQRNALNIQPWHLIWPNGSRPQ